MTSKPDKDKQGTTTAAAEDPVSQLKLSISKLAEGIQKMGDVLGAKLETPTVKEKACAKPLAESANVRKPENDLKSAVSDASKGKEKQIAKKQSHPEADQQKSAKEVRAQRANKAAEKKARAEAAAAKKAALKEQEKAQDKSEPSNKSKRKQEKVSAPLNKTQVNGENNQVQPPPTTKSALRESGKQLPVREVQFDLSANTVASPSDESVSSDVPIGPCSECPEPPSTAHIHPAFLNLAVRCELDVIDDVDSLCLNFIAAFKEYLADWIAQRQKENRDESSLSHDLNLALRPQIAHLTQESRWPLPHALGNIVRQLKKEIMKIGTPDRNGRLQDVGDVKKWLEDCEEEYFGSAYRAISEYLLVKMRTAPNVITYDWCPLVNKVLLDAVEKDSNAIFTVIDPEMEGKGMRHIQSFVERRIHCRYTDLNSVGAVMKSGSMLLLGCAAVLSNGCIVAPKGSMLVALTAKAFNVPVLVASQTFKFVDKVQGGGRVALLKREAMELVPSDLITAIVTDIRVLPPSSAPAVLKAKALDLE
ncbi:hypothetical protein V3C99_015113 [Haemonchus contortus]